MLGNGYTESVLNCPRASEKGSYMNPLLSRDFLIPFDRVEPDHIETGINETLERAETDLEAICAFDRTRSYENTIGDVQLAAVWEDPSFDPTQRAFYYVRVLQIPTPRWTAYDAKTFQLDVLPDNVPLTIQDRAYTSPIWYTPEQ